MFIIMKKGITRENYGNIITNDDFLKEDDLLLKNLAEMWRNFQNIVFKTKTRQTTLFGYFNMI
jgi:hypothetical protein